MTIKNGKIKELSPRERTVLALVVKGMTSKEIGAQIGVKPSSIDTYRSRLMGKLGVENVVGLVRLAIREKVVRP